MTDITTFLLARYDEEEAVARRAIETDRLLGRGLRQQIDPGLVVPYVATTAERFLADIAAKRALLRHLPGERYTIEEILVQPYANHREFDPSWRTS